MGYCEWIVIVLEENYSKTVCYEINKSITLIEHDNIFIFVKSTSKSLTVWKKELDNIKKLKSKSIKYLPYSDISELEVGLSKAFNTRMNEICKKEKIKIFV